MAIVILNMVLLLCNKCEWETFLTAANIPETVANSYAKILVENCFTETMLSQLTAEHLREIEITVLGDILSIIKLPSITSNVTHPQFRKFSIDWSVYKKDDLPSYIGNCITPVQHLRLQRSNG